MKIKQTVLLFGLTLGMLASAADQEDTTKTSRSHNPLTGTDSTTTKNKKRYKDASGKTHEVDAKKTTKQHTDGKTETSESKDESTTPND